MAPRAFEIGSPDPRGASVNAYGIFSAARRLHHLRAIFMLMPFLLFRRFVVLFVVLLNATPSSQRIAQDKNGSADFAALAKTAAAARDENNVVGAIQNYRQAIRLQPDWQEGLWYLGTLEYERDHYADAIPPFQRLTQLAPAAGPAWTFLGLCEYETKDYASALQHLTKGQELGGTDDVEILRVANYHLVLLLIRDANFASATATLQSLAAQGQAGAQIKTAAGLAALRVPLLPEQVDPSEDALLQEVGDANLLVIQGQADSALQRFALLSEKYPDTPYLHFAYASALFAAGKYPEAAMQFRKETGISPQSFAAHKGLAKSLEAAGEHEKAREEFAAAKKLQPKKSEAEDRILQRYENRASSTDAGNPTSSHESLGGSSPSFEELSRQAEFARDSGDADLATQRYQQALQIRPDWQEGLWNLAMLSYSTHHYSDAIAALKRWVGRTPNLGTAWAVMGLSEFELADYDNALIHLQRGQQLGLSGNLDSGQLARYRLAILLMRNGQFESAESLLMSVAGQGPLAPEVRFALGMSLLRMQTLPGDVADDKKPMVVGTGAIAELLKDSKYGLAFPKFEAMIKQYPSAPFLHYVYGTALATFSRYDEAEEQFRKEIVLSPASELPYVQLTSIALKRHDAGKALPSAQQAVKLAPRAAEAHYLLGRTYLEMGNNQQAIDELEAAGKITPESAQIHFNLARAYAKANLPDKAERERSIFARLNGLAEQQRTQQGNQSYGAHNTAGSAFSPTDAHKADSPERPN